MPACPTDLDHAFYGAKEKAFADKLLTVLETLAPGAAKKHRAEMERIANLSDEEYAKEFEEEHSVDPVDPVHAEL